jgi:hypothetical protein
MQALPSDATLPFSGCPAPEQPTNEIETVTVKELALPTEVFAPEEPRDPSGARVDLQTVMVPNLPTEVFAPGEPHAEVQTAIVEGPPHELLVERGAWTSQPAAHGVEPIEEDPALRGVPGPLDPDLDMFCTIASQLIPASEPVSTGSGPSPDVPPLNAVTNSSIQSELTSIELGPDLDQGIEFELNCGAKANEIVADKSTIPSSDLNQSPSTDVGLSAASTARAGTTPQTALNERANPQIVPKDAGSCPPPELDQAVSLTRDTLRAWAHVFAGSGPLKVTTR